MGEPQMRTRTRKMLNGLRLTSGCLYICIHARVYSRVWVNAPWRVRCIFLSVDKRTDERDVVALIKIRCGSNDRRLSGLFWSPPSRIREAAARLVRLTLSGPMPRVYTSNIHIYTQSLRARGPLSCPRRSSRSDTDRFSLSVPLSRSATGPLPVRLKYETRWQLKSTGSLYNAVGLQAMPRERKPVNWKRGDRVTGSPELPPRAAAALSLRIPGVSSFLAESPPFPSRSTARSLRRYAIKKKNLDSLREPWLATACNNHRWMTQLTFTDVQPFLH